MAARQYLVMTNAAWLPVQDMRCFDALCDLYGMLGEDDMVFGLWQVSHPRVGICAGRVSVSQGIRHAWRGRHNGLGAVAD